MANSTHPAMKHRPPIGVMVPNTFTPLMDSAQKLPEKMTMPAPPLLGRLLKRIVRTAHLLAFAEIALHAGECEFLVFLRDECAHINLVSAFVLKFVLFILKLPGITPYISPTYLKQVG
jgi:hypothetical protein